VGGSGVWLAAWIWKQCKEKQRLMRSSHAGREEESQLGASVERREYGDVWPSLEERKIDLLLICLMENKRSKILKSILDSAEMFLERYCF
jgi:hypothetical protein